jgi:phosphohistidine phosphatase SixA
VLVLVLAFVLVLVGCAPPPAVATAHPPTSACTRGRTFILVRHAEKASPPEAHPDDPPLSEKGRARAEALAMTFEHAGITRLVATHYRRTQETLAPLGQRLGLGIETRSSKEPDELVRELRASPDGSVVMVASHSNVLPRLVRELGSVPSLRGVSGDSLADSDYGRVYIIAAGCTGAPQVLELSSGNGPEEKN